MRHEVRIFPVDIVNNNFSIVVDRLTIFNFFSPLIYFHDDRSMTINVIIYSFHYSIHFFFFLFGKISDIKTRAIFDRSINFETRFFFFFYNKTFHPFFFFFFLSNEWEKNSTWTSHPWTKATCRDRSTRANQFSYTTGAPWLIQ